MEAWRHQVVALSRSRWCRGAEGKKAHRNRRACIGAVRVSDSDTNADDTVIVVASKLVCTIVIVSLPSTAAARLDLPPASASAESACYRTKPPIPGRFSRSHTTPPTLPRPQKFFGTLPPVHTATVQRRQPDDLNTARRIRTHACHCASYTDVAWTHAGPSSRQPSHALRLDALHTITAVHSADPPYHRTTAPPLYTRTTAPA